MKATGDLLSIRSSKVTSRSKFCITTVSLIGMDSFKGNISSFIYTFQTLKPSVWLLLGSFMNKLRNWGLSQNLTAVFLSFSHIQSWLYSFRHHIRSVYETSWYYHLFSYFLSYLGVLWLLPGHCPDPFAAYIDLKGVECSETPIDNLDWAKWFPVLYSLVT